MPGLAESVVIVEGFAFFNDLLFSGILFALIPTVYLVPRLYGKIEPLLGMKPRDRNDKYSLKEIIGLRLVVLAVFLAISAFFFEYLSESDFNMEWEADFLEMFGEWYIWVSMAVAAMVAIITIVVMLRKKTNWNDKEKKVS